MELNKFNGNTADTTTIINMNNDRIPNGELNNNKNDKNSVDITNEGIANKLTFNEGDTLLVGRENDVVDSSGMLKGKTPYAKKQIAAEGMIDIALLTANANQLRFIIAYNSHSATYELTLGLIIASLILQVFAGSFIIFKRQFLVKGQPNYSERKRTYRNILVFVIFLIITINVFVTSFSTIVEPAPVPIVIPPPPPIPIAPVTPPNPNLL